MKPREQRHGKPSEGGKRVDGCWHWDRPRGMPDGAAVRVCDRSHMMHGRVGVVVAWVSRAGVFEVSFRIAEDHTPCLLRKPFEELKLLGVRVTGWGTFHREQIERVLRK